MSLKFLILLYLLIFFSTVGNRIQYKYYEYYFEYSYLTIIAWNLMIFAILNLLYFIFRATLQLNAELIIGYFLIFLWGVISFKNIKFKRLDSLNDLADYYIIHFLIFIIIPLINMFILHLIYL